MGDFCCSFWRSENRCAGWPGADIHDCMANDDGTCCLLFPKTPEERNEARALRMAELSITNL
ncbi:MAG: hypothetical protein PHY23_00235 [Oscillospiraceae bacterium]|nr:hypothetical protein [Oscillospiraceae bacterium]